MNPFVVFSPCAVAVWSPGVHVLMIWVWPWAASWNRLVPGCPGHVLAGLCALCPPEEGIGEVLEKEDCMQALSGQIFMGMVSSQYQARLDIVRLIDGLVNACIRFVYFSLEDELKSKVRERRLSLRHPCPFSSQAGACLFIAICLLQVFAEKMGLETGWNCHISLTPNGDMPGSDIPPSSPSHAGSLHDDLNQGEDRSLFWEGGEKFPSA